MVNDLKRRVHKQQEIELIRIKLEKAEQSGFTTDTKEDILKQAKCLLLANKIIKT